MRKGTFEDRIFYGNHLTLNEDQWDCLKSIVKQCQPPIPYYVSTVTRLAVIRGKSKMVNTWTFLFANHTSLVKMPSCRDREEDGRGCANHTYFFGVKIILHFLCNITYFPVQSVLLKGVQSGLPQRLSAKAHGCACHQRTF